MAGPGELGFLNGHVPVTAIITAAALVAAVIERRDAVVLSNEWSASVPTVVADGIAVNHQWSKSDEFERAFGDLVLATLGSGISVFSYLRPRSELWVSRQFAGLTRYHHAFRSCNRAFHQDPAQRLDHWCGRCDKCCFIDLVLAPFMDRVELEAVFAGDEPLQDPANEERFRALLGLGTGAKPFECVGDIDECRAATLLAAERADRAGTGLLARLRAELAGTTPADPMALLAAAGPPPHSGPLCANRSPGPRSLTRPSASGGSASRDGPACAASGPWAATRCWSTTRRPPPAIDGLEVLATDAGGLAALARCDVVVKSPGISRYRPEVAQLEAAGVAVCGGLGLFMAEADPTRVACITGTKGKSTTTALAVHLLTGLGVRARAGGNIGHPPWDPAGDAAPDYWIVETSSFQVPDLSGAPRVVAVTSLSPDHLDWHGTVERYYADKLSLCTKPGVATALADGTDEELRTQSGLLGPHVRWVSGAEVERDTAWSQSLGLAGPHNARNAVGGTRRGRSARRPGRVRRRPPGRSGAGFRRVAQPLPFPGLGRPGRVRRRRPVDQRAAGAGRAGGLRRAPRGAARRRARPRPRLRAARPDDRGTDRTDARRHHAGQRTAHRPGGARRLRAGGWR